MKFILYILNISQPEVGSAKEFLTENGFWELIPVLVDKHKVYTCKLLAKIFVYKHWLCYLNVQNVKQKISLFHQPIVLCLAYSSQ